LVVSSAEDAEVFGAAVAAEGTGVLVVELEEGVRFATAAVRGDVSALEPVTVEDLAAGGACDAGARLAVGGGRGRARAFRPFEAGAFEIGE
jgi:hypothetical protein